ncbi:hypothetical protein K9I61_004898 [Escherichia coli]|nr:hypothetical protein [Escherichia coli]
MQGEKQQPYFFNPGMTVEQLEDWLEQQKLHLSRLNRPGFPGECFICELRLPDHRF